MTDVAFEVLEYDAQLRLVTAVAAAALHRYVLGDVRCSLIQYEDNAVYDVVNDQGDRFILRVNAYNGRNAAEQTSEMQYLAALGAQGLRVPEPVANLDGTFVSLVSTSEVPSPRECVLFRRMPGEPPQRGVDRRTIAQIGESTARLHRHAESFVRPKGFVRPTWGWERLCGSGSVLQSERRWSRLSPHQREIFDAVCAKVRESTLLLGQESSIWGLIHGDLHIDNILLSNDGIGFIDFDDCGDGYFMHDVASVLDSLCRRVATSSAEYADMRDSYLNGYDRIRSLPSSPGQHLATCKVLRELWIANFICESTNAVVHSWGLTRLSEITAQLEAYLQ